MSSKTHLSPKAAKQQSRIPSTDEGLRDLAEESVD